MTAPATLRERLGICQWFHYEDHAAVERTAALLHELGARHLRTGVSWADFHRPGGRRWYDWQMAQLADFEVLLSVWHTPPSIAERPWCASPPRRLADYGDFLVQLADLYGDRFAAFELWNEPNNRMKWDFPALDPDWRKFGEMLRLAGPRAQAAGKPTVLGGMIPVDETWLDLVASYGALGGADVVAIHGFPHMWWDEAPCWDWQTRWHGWPERLERIGRHGGGRPVWITETGLATVDLASGGHAREALQVRMLEQAAAAPCERVYWYCLVDLDPAREAIEGFHVDENEYHLGLVRWDGSRKPAFERFRDLMESPLSSADSPRRVAR